MKKVLLIILSVAYIGTTVPMGDMLEDIVLKSTMKQAHNPSARPIKDALENTAAAGLLGTMPLGQAIFWSIISGPPRGFISAVVYSIMGYFTNQAMTQNFFVSTMSKRSTGNRYSDIGLMNTYAGDGF